MGRTIRSWLPSWRSWSPGIRAKPNDRATNAALVKSFDQLCNPALVVINEDRCRGCSCDEFAAAFAGFDARAQASAAKRSRRGVEGLSRRERPTIEKAWRSLIIGIPG